MEEEDSMSDTGYTTKPVEELSDAQLLEETLQAGYDSGYYAGKKWNATASDELARETAMLRRNECFAELKRRLAAAEALATAARNAQRVLHEEAWNWQPVEMTCGCHWTECDHETSTADVECYVQLATADEQLVEALAAWDGGKGGEP